VESSPEHLTPSGYPSAAAVASVTFPINICLRTNRLVERVRNSFGRGPEQVKRGETAEVVLWNALEKMVLAIL